MGAVLLGHEKRTVASIWIVFTDRWFSSVREVSTENKCALMMWVLQTWSDLICKEVTGDIRNLLPWELFHCAGWSSGKPGRILALFSFRLSHLFCTVLLQFENSRVRTEYFQRSYRRRKEQTIHSHGQNSGIRAEALIFTALWILFTLHFLYHVLI